VSQTGDWEMAELLVIAEELCNSHGGVPRAGVGTYLCCSNRDGIKCGALTIAGANH